MSLDKDKKVKIQHFMRSLADLIKETNVGFSMDGSVTYDGKPIGILEQTYNSLELLDFDDVPIYEISLEKDEK